MKSLVQVVLAGAISLTAIGAASALQEPAKPPVVKHTLENRANCTMCHSGALPNAPAMPAATHKGRLDRTCLWCHAPDAAIQTKTPKAIPHTLENRDNCVMCHMGSLPNTPVAPADHEGRESTDCQMCHKPAA